jgi:hypothetical protein
MEAHRAAAGVVDALVKAKPGSEESYGEIVAELDSSADILEGIPETVEHAHRIREIVYSYARHRPENPRWQADYKWARNLEAEMMRKAMEGPG